MHDSGGENDFKIDLDNVVVVTRHPALVALLLERGIIGHRLDLETPIIEHATIEDVRGKHVIGVLPLRLAAEAESVTEIPLDLPRYLRGDELGIEMLRQYAGDAVTYKVSVIRKAGDG